MQDENKKKPLTMEVNCDLQIRLLDIITLLD